MADTSSKSWRELHRRDNFATWSMSRLAIIFTKNGTWCTRYPPKRALNGGAVLIEVLSTHLRSLLRKIFLWRAKTNLILILPQVAHPSTTLARPQFTIHNLSSDLLWMKRPTLLAWSVARNRGTPTKASFTRFTLILLITRVPVTITLAKKTVQKPEARSLSSGSQTTTRWRTKTLSPIGSLSQSIISLLSGISNALEVFVLISVRLTRIQSNL